LFKYHGGVTHVAPATKSSIVLGAVKQATVEMKVKVATATTSLRAASLLSILHIITGARRNRMSMGIIKALAALSINAREYM